MALNDEAVEDLPDDTLIDEDVVKSSPVAPVTDQTTTIVVKTPEVKQEATLLSEADVQAITDTDIKFKLIGDQTEKIVDLEEIEQEFISQESIDRNTAQFLDEHFKGLLGPRLTLEEFTRTPSKTNFLAAQKHVKLCLSQEQAAAVIEFSEFTTNTLKGTSEILEKLKEDFISQFLIIMSGTARLSEAVIADISQSKNTIVPYRNGEHVEFVDVATLDLMSLDFGNLELKPETVSLLTMHKKNIEAIIANSSVKTLIVLAVDCDKISYPVDKEILVHAAEKPIDLLTLAKFFNSNALRDYLNTFGATADEAKATIDHIRTEAAELQQNYPDIKEYLVAKSATLHNAINTTMQLVSTINNLNTLALNVSTMFKCLSELSK